MWQVHCAKNIIYVALEEYHFRLICTLFVYQSAQSLDAMHNWLRLFCSSLDFSVDGCFDGGVNGTVGQTTYARIPYTDTHTQGTHAVIDTDFSVIAILENQLTSISHDQ